MGGTSRSSSSNGDSNRYAELRGETLEILQRTLALLDEEPSVLTESENLEEDSFSDVSSLHALAGPPGSPGLRERAAHTESIAREARKQSIEKWNQGLRDNPPVPPECIRLRVDLPSTRSRGSREDPNRRNERSRGDRTSITGVSNWSRGDYTEPDEISKWSRGNQTSPVGVSNWSRGDFAQTLQNPTLLRLR